jgi:hypothetical protein
MECKTEGYGKDVVRKAEGRRSEVKGTNPKQKEAKQATNPKRIEAKQASCLAPPLPSSSSCPCLPPFPNLLLSYLPFFSFPNLISLFSSFPPYLMGFASLGRRRLHCLPSGSNIYIYILHVYIYYIYIYIYIYILHVCMCVWIYLRICR